MTKYYSISDFAKLTLTTKRTLQYYDKIDLLKPNKCKKGYRQYVDHDLIRLQQIVT